MDIEILRTHLVHVFKNWKLLFKKLWKYVLVKKCVETRKILFKNWKLLFRNTHQTPPKNLNFQL